jgi:hypothetical protein
VKLKNGIIDILPEFRTVVPWRFSSDSKYIIGPSGDSKGNIGHIYNLSTAEEIPLYEYHPTMITQTIFSSHHVAIISTCTNLVIWVPEAIEDF